jgi:hypothetical protein
MEISCDWVGGEGPRARDYDDGFADEPAAHGEVDDQVAGLLVVLEVLDAAPAALATQGGDGVLGTHNSNVEGKRRARRTARTALYAPLIGGHRRQSTP